MPDILFLGSKLRRETVAGDDLGDATLLVNQSVSEYEMIDHDMWESRRKETAESQKRVSAMFAVRKRG